MRLQMARSYRLLLSAVLCVLFITVLFSAETRAQEATAKIIGTITDQQSAVIAGVEITATNTSTNVINSTVSGKDGYYQILDLPIGTYHVVARHQGFRTSKPITLLELFGVVDGRVAECAHRIAAKAVLLLPVSSVIQQKLGHLCIAEIDGKIQC